MRPTLGLQRAVDLLSPQMAQFQLAVAVLFFSVLAGALLARELLRMRTARSSR